MKKSFGRGNGGGFRQPRFDDQYQRRDSGGRGSHMAAPAWQSRDSYLRDLDLRLLDPKDPDRDFLNPWEPNGHFYETIEKLTVCRR